MKLTLAVVSSVFFLSSTTSATPVEQKSRGEKVALSKRWSFAGPNGTDTEALRNHLSHVTACVISSSLVVYLTNCSVQ